MGGGGGVQRATITLQTLADLDLVSGLEATKVC